MDDARRVVARVRRRMTWIRFVDRLQWTAAISGCALLTLATLSRLLGNSVALLPAFGAAVLVAVVAAAVLTSLSQVSRARAASEADRILESRERISTALAVSEGRAEDPFGFGPAVANEASHAARGAATGSIRKSLKPRLRRATGVAAACTLLLFLVPLLPVPVSADPSDDPALVAEQKKVEEALRALERKSERRVSEATKKAQKELKILAERIRQESARLRGTRPRRSEAMARLAQLEREAGNAARKFAGMKPVETKGASVERKDLQDLADALRAFEKADLKGTKERFSQLWDKLRTNKLDELTQAEATFLGRQASEMSRAIQRLAGAAGQDSELAKLLEGLAQRENMMKLAEALQKLREALGENAPQPPNEEEMREALRNYRTLQMSDAEIEELMKQIEELMRMIEAGEEIKFCRGDMGGLIGLGLGLGLGGGMPGRGAGQGQGTGAGQGLGTGSGTGKGDGTGGAGQGRGGDPGMTEDGATTRQDLIPGQASQVGNATLIRTIRSLPDPDEDPEGYERLLREATLEAEEAIRRGEIPRRYRGYVRRFFGGTEDE